MVLPQPPIGICDQGDTREKLSGKRISVAGLVHVALSDQARLLEIKAEELKRWGQGDRVVFFKWFGTTDGQARERIYHRLGILTKLNERYSVQNFRRAPHREGVFAFVRPNDPTKLFVDMAFVTAPRVGENSRAGTITHEMSHFLIAGGTKDHTYGTRNCKALARSNPELALSNADNFEYWVENAP
jgi:hypothetical protein